ncbi:ribonuclease H-like protein [Amniculicola lignicola CBS 123094]|uniref:Ribonuclease H-like protein n=1 Tax=Amniculicola lignicola CBS 123094 TaxID=1392246 RepID=A0A6A5WSZ3_9PLEO|nr:ribonuclease H-like protein [Amniculicola lignicola CBS 123094]
MPPKRAGPTVATLRSLLMQIGSSASANRDELISRLSRDLLRPKISGFEERKKSIRILSVDMGIRNLAFCVADVKMGTPSKKGGEPPAAHMYVEAWRRLDVGEEVMRPVSQDSTSHTVLQSVDDEDAADPYSPPTLSQTAYTLLSQTLLPYNPDIILLERQRWRSSSGPSIQQWTVRVNTLEGMIWAILTALREEANKSTKEIAKGTCDYQLFGVYPKRVGQYWIGTSVEEAVSPKSKGKSKKLEDEIAVGPEGEVEELTRSNPDRKRTVKKLSRAKIEKSTKIKLVRSWLATGASSTTSSSGQVSALQTPMEFTFSPEADATREGLCATAQERKSSRKPGQSALETKELRKLDDVTDCFLQAAAWVAWEGNRRKISSGWNSETGDFVVPHSESPDDAEIIKVKIKKETKPRKTTMKSAKEKEIPDEEAPKRPRRRAPT